MHIKERKFWLTFLWLQITSFTSKSWSSVFSMIFIQLRGHRSNARHLISVGWMCCQRRTARLLPVWKGMNWIMWVLTDCTCGLYFRTVRTVRTVFQNCSVLRRWYYTRGNNITWTLDSLTHFLLNDYIFTIYWRLLICNNYRHVMWISILF